MNNELPTRKIIRLEKYDYSKNGLYFVTFCVKNRYHILGSVVGTTAPGRPYVELSHIGKCLDETIKIANKNNVKIDNYVIMPNHVHMIAALNNNQDDRGRSSLQQVVRNIKSFVTKYAGFQLWQPRFHDHIIRNDAEYTRISEYIDNNPALWSEDEYYSPHDGA